MTPIEQILLGLFMGFIGIGLPTIRTIQVMEGKYIKVWFVSILATANLYAFTRFAMQDNYWWMIANAIGAASSVTLISYKRSKKEKNEKNKILDN